MNPYSYSALLGLGLWLAGTAALRLSGPGLLHLNAGLLYPAAFVAMAVLIPRIFHRLKLEKDARFPAVTLLMLPTLILDPFSCAFFPSVFPNLDPGTAGVFGGLMLICCGGAVAGVWMQQR